MARDNHDCHEYTGSRIARLEAARLDRIERRETIRQALMFLVTAAVLAAYWLFGWQP